MKRVIITSLVLMAFTLAQAQLRVIPKMNVGDKYVYDCVAESNNPMMTFNAKSTIEFKVTEKTANGYVVDMMMSSMENDGKNDKASALMNMTEGMIKDVTIRVATDKNGKALRIVNYDKVKAHCSAYIDKLITMVYADHPEMEKTMPKDKMLRDAKSTLKEEILLEGIKKTGTNPFSIFGKTISEGMTDTYVNTQNIKMKRTYHLQGKKITCNGVSNMTEEEMKEFILNKIKDSMPDKYESVSESIDMLMSSGLMKVDGKEDTVYELMYNNWPRTIDMTVSMKLMGQNITVKARSTLKK